jgi:RNA polymerase sigma-70 factor (ECF subfamily)
MQPAEDVRDDDAVLVQAIAGGSEEALRALYDRYGGLVFTVAVRLMGDREAASEVVQDVFLRCWERAGSFEPARGRARSWLMTIARNRTIDVMRMRRVPDQNPRDIDDEAHLNGLAHAADHGDAVATRVTVNDAMTTLPRAQREALELALLGPLTHREIAAVLDVPLGTVKTRIRDGMARLRTELTATAAPAAHPRTRAADA